MSATSFNAAERIAAIAWARENLYDFARWMFLQRKGYSWKRALHHKIVCDALMRVFRGECKRLIIGLHSSLQGLEVRTNADDDVFRADPIRLENQR